MKFLTFLVFLAFLTFSGLSTGAGNSGAAAAISVGSVSSSSASKSKNNDAAKAVTKTKSGDQKTEKKTWKLSDIQKMKPFEFDKYEKEIDLARKEGRIVQG